VNKRWLLTSLFLVLPAAVAQDAGLPTRAELAAKLQGVAATDLRESALDGFYEVRLGSRIGYVSKDGRFLFEGELYDLELRRNVTEAARAEARVDLLAGVAPGEMIVFRPTDRPVEHTVTIFTDVDCGYCRQFHREIDQVLARGIEVHYLFYPRTGPATESWGKAERVWCAQDRNTALTNAKLGGHVPELTCADNPVSDHYDLGHQVGVTGTPSIYSPDGTHIGGYLPPQQLLDTLNQLAVAE
jgi:thiol:disulfide interchange protein DsbC